MCGLGWLAPGALRHRKSQPVPPLPQIVRTFRIETRKASKAVARRKVRPFSPCLGDSPTADSEELGIFFFLIRLFLEVRSNSLSLLRWSTAEVRGLWCSIGGTEKSSVQKLGGLRSLTPFRLFTRRNRAKPSPQVVIGAPI